jgi:hypothetical protein
MAYLATNSNALNDAHGKKTEYEMQKLKRVCCGGACEADRTELMYFSRRERLDTGSLLCRFDLRA